jgi:hypothetical protein
MGGVESTTSAARLKDCARVEIPSFDEGELRILISSLFASIPRLGGLVEIG